MTQLVEISRYSVLYLNFRIKPVFVLIFRRSMTTPRVHTQVTNFTVTVRTFWNKSDIFVTKKIFIQISQFFSQILI